MKPYKWRTRNASYIYVDSATGSDTFGDGTMNNPYQSLGKAWRGHGISHPSYIVCRGTFCEDMADGTHATAIAGDYYGAATFDGAETYTMYGFSTPNMIFVNCVSGEYDTNVYAGSPLLAGVGRANHSGGVGYAHFVAGVSASSVLAKRTSLYMGCIGGQNVDKAGVVSPRPNPRHLFWFGGFTGSTCQNMSVYDVPKEYRRWYSTYNTTFISSVFGKCAFIADEAATFRRCTFASDCTWWHNDEQFIPQGETSGERQESVKAWLAECVLASGHHRAVIDDCTFSDKTSEEIWNNPDMGDLTLRLANADGDVITADGYRGAFPPSLNIPIMNDSTGEPNTWDEKTADGLVMVADNRIVVGGDTDETKGSVKSKVITVDPDKIAISGIFAHYANQYQTQRVQLSEETQGGETYSPGDALPVGRYVVNGGSCVYDERYVAVNEVIVATEEGKTFAPAEEGADVTVKEIVDANVIDNMWLRTVQIPYLYIKASDGLQAGGTYLNLYDKPIVYRGRAIAPGESFEAENDTDAFSCDGNPDYKIGVMFDDSRVPAQPWIPAQMWGEYFAGKSGAAFQTDADGKILGSGNYLSWLPASEGGYSASVRKTRAHARYLQLMITANRI